MTHRATAPADTGDFPFLDRLESIFGLPITPDEKAATLRKLLPADDAGKDAAIMRALDAAPPLTPGGEAAAAATAEIAIGDLDVPGLAHRVVEASKLIGQFMALFPRRPEAQRARLFERTLNLLWELECVRLHMTGLERATLLTCLLFTPERSP